MMTLIAILFASSIFGQLTVDMNMTPQQMVQNIVGNGVEVSNVVVTACPNTYGYYHANATEMGTSQGILLTTGKAEYAIGPNNSVGSCSTSGTTFPFSPLCSYFDNQCPGDPALTALAGYPTGDATIIEFDIRPQGDSLWFKYTFASEEYFEWSTPTTDFNDVFGFFISGPGISATQNLAVVPNTNIPVSASTINHLVNSQYIYNNTSPYGQFIQYDGFTLGLVASIGGLTPCATYHLKLAIADGSDRTWDTGVFINKIESNPVAVLTATSNGLDYMVEGCNSGTVSFSREQIDSSPMDVTYWIGGTATNGVDYVPQLGSGIPFEPNTITIPANAQTVTIELNAVLDNIDEGVEYLTIYLGNPLCTGLEVLDSTRFYIHDFIDVAVNPSETSICAGQCVELTGTSTLGPLADFEWSAGVSDPNSLIVEVCPTETTIYTLTATVGECTASDNATINVSSITVDLDGEDIHCEGGFTGSISSTVNGGEQPYTYVWTGPNGFISSDGQLTDLEEGEYCVSITDANGCEAESCITLVETNELNAVATLSSYVCFPISCFGACDGSINLNVTGGVQPYSFSWTGPSGYTSDLQNISGLCAGTYVIEITDDAGCIFTNQFILSQPTQLVIQVTGTVDLLCTGVETGQASVSSTGGCSPYTYSWSHDTSVIGPNAINLASGEYSVSVTDQNGCTNDGSVSITINDPINPVTATVDDISLYPGGFGVSCPGAEDGFVDITPSGGTVPYSITWFNVTINQQFSTSEDLIDAPCGEYQFTVTDDTGCTYSQNIIITCVPAITVNYTTVPNPCGTAQGGVGEISIEVAGGHAGTYTFSWEGPDGFTSTDEDLTDLNSGDYILTVTDSEGCITQIIINVGQNDLFAVTTDVTNASCFGVCDGAIDITIDPVGSYTYSWTGPNGFVNSNQDVSNLCAGTYTLTVTTDDCEEVFTFNITQPQQLVINPTVVNPLCYGQNNGSINISVANGSGDYSFNWEPNNSCAPPFAGSTNQNLSNLFDCDYTVVVTDNVTGCTATSTIDLEAPQVMSIVVETTNFLGGYNISCNGANDGQISVFVTGGTPDCDLFAPHCYSYDWVANCADQFPGDYGNDPNCQECGTLGAGTYGVLVTDANGCLATTCVPLTEPEAIESTSVIDHVDCGETSGSITPNLTGGSGSYVAYQWTCNIGSNAPNSVTLTGLAPGNYTLTVTDSNDCEETFTYTINQIPTPAIAVVNQMNLTCAGECTGEFTINLSSGTAPYSVNVNGDIYSVTGEGDELTLENLCGDVYQITVTDANDCEITSSVTITEPQPLDIGLSAIIQDPSQIYHLQCLGDDNGAIASSVSGGTQGYSYEWIDVDLNLLSTNDSLFGLVAGTYCLTVTDANGCSIQECFEITEPENQLEATYQLSLYNDIYNISCFGAQDGSIDMTVTGGVGGYTYEWLGEGAVDNQEDQSGLAAGQYALVIFDENFCQLPFVFNLIQPAPIVLDAQVSLYDGGFNIPCNGNCNGTIDLGISGGSSPYTVAWTGPNGFTSDQEELEDLCAGTYSVTVTDASGCEQTQVVIMSEPNPLTVVIENNYNCSTAIAQLCATGTGGSGSYTYSWDSGETSQCITVDESGNYCVTISDSNGCEEEICYVVNITTPLSVTGAIANASCGLCNGAINTTITASPGYVFTWDNNATTEDLTELCEGVYELTVTDANNCSTVHTFTIVQNSPIQVTITPTNATCNAGNTGAASVFIFGATQPVTNSWVDSQGNVLGTESSVSSLIAGSYEYHWSDAAGCSGIEEFVIFEPSALEVEITTSVFGDFNISTVGGSDGSISVDVSGGTPQYSFDWSHDENATGAFEDGLIAGDYTITITDANGCVLDTVITLIQPEEIRLFTGLSPNGDGFNDVYIIPGVLYCKQNNFIVFNRWGNIVYEKANYRNDWYGQSKDGGVLSDGTYFVIFEGCDNKKLSTYVDLRRE